jgi:hypothetical protein
MSGALRLSENPLELAVEINGYDLAAILPVIVLKGFGGALEAGEKDTRAHDALNGAIGTVALSDVKQPVNVGELGRLVDKRGHIEILERHSPDTPQGDSATFQLVKSRISQRLITSVNSRLSVSPECATEATTAGTQLVASPIEPER